MECLGQATQNEKLKSWNFKLESYLTHCPPLVQNFKLRCIHTTVSRKCCPFAFIIKDRITKIINNLI